RRLLVTRPPRSARLPYTTLFRSRLAGHAHVVEQDPAVVHPVQAALGAAVRGGHPRKVVAMFVAQTHHETVHAVVCAVGGLRPARSEEHTSELQSRFDLVCRLLLE